MMKRIRITAACSFLALFVALVVFACSSEDSREGSGSFGKALFSNMFHEILDNLMDNHWVGNGDWSDDAQGDDVAFGPWLLYSMGADQELETYMHMATRTVNYEVGQLEKLFHGELWDSTDILGSLVNIMKAVLGGPALIDGYRFTHDPLYLEVLDFGLEAITWVSLVFPELLIPFVFDPVVVVGIAADMNLDAYEVTREPAYLTGALLVLQAAEDRFWNEDKGYYGKECWDWPEATLLMALAAAYRFTRSPFYQERAERLLGTVEEQLWDGNASEGGFFGHDRVVVGSKALSGNNIFTRAFLDWYEETGEPHYLERAVDTLNFLEEVLYADRMLRHHWTPEEGRTDEFCTGCNLMTLGNIYRLNRLRGTPIAYSHEPDHE